MSCSLNSFQGVIGFRVLGLGLRVWRIGAHMNPKAAWVAFRIQDFVLGVNGVRARVRALNPKPQTP